ncbi:MAG: DUF1365 domain-containing protein [Dechloromonas sp.]|nr:DUF1365 domain-containing protein [Dechloromonas sp.]
MSSAPRLLIGHVMHRRLRPAVNAFTYPVFFVQLPLRDLAAADSPLFGIERRALMSFRSADHGPRDGSPLLPWIEALLEARGLPADGDIVLQTFPRVLGFVFNPVSFWFCRDRQGMLIAVLAEVNNTFGGSHSYLLHRNGEPLRDGEVLEADKVFHVSPFNEIAGGYRFRFHLARPAQLCRIAYDDAEGEVLLTAIGGKARPWSTGRLLAAFLRMPLLTFGVFARIHWQALRLWLKGVPFHGARQGQAHLQESTK